MKSFRNWTRQEIADKFGLDIKNSCQNLDNWLEVSGNIPNETEIELKRLQLKLKENVDTWNCLLYTSPSPRDS